MASFAIVPAAGRSRRMGAPKLLLPWEQGDSRPGTVIESVLDAWRSSRVTALVVIVDARDGALIDVIRQVAARPSRTSGVPREVPIELVIADPPPPEMKDSIRLGLDHIASGHDPANGDVWLLAPADMPTISPAVIDQLLSAAAANVGQVLSPTHAGRRGHPVLFPWRLAAEVALLGDHEGVNQLLKRHPVVEIPCGPDCLPGDIDTVEDYTRQRTANPRASAARGAANAGDAGVDRS